MRLGFALACALPVVTAGCSLIYNPNNIDKPDPDALQPIDAEVIVDADPTNLALDKVDTPLILEGQGVEGARRAVIVVQGSNITSDAKIQLVDHATGMSVASLVVADAETEVAANHKMIAVPVTANIDVNDADIVLDVKVTQNAGGTPVSAMLTSDATTPVITLRGLPVLNDEMHEEVFMTGTAAASGAVVFDKLYAKFNVKKITVSGGNPLRIRSITSVKIGDPIDISATALTKPGVAGNLGGGAGPISGTAPSGLGPCGGPGGVSQPSGGTATAGVGGGLGTAPSNGTCVVPGNLSELVKNLGSGGGGGGGTPGFILGSAMGGAGGASGGTMQIDAGSTLTINGATSNGFAGTAGGNSNAAAGGGGSGGAILLRARGALSAGTITLAGASTGGNGLVRYDSGIATAAITPVSAASYRGPSLEAVDEIVKNPLPTFKLFGSPGASLKLTIDGFTNDGNSSHRSISVELGDDGSNSVTLQDGQNLFRGVNSVCAVVDGTTATPAPDEARDCISVVYVLQNGQ